MADRIPPQNLEAERAVIGAILIDDSSIDKISDVLEPSNFYDPKHEIIFSCILELYKTNTAIDVLTLTDQLKKIKKFKQVGGSVYLSEIVAGVPTSANIKHYADIVKEMATRRALISFGAKLDERARAEKEEVEEILDELESNILSLSQNTTEEDFFDTSTLIELQMQKADEYAKNPEGIRGIPCGLEGVDDLLGGFHRSDLIILAARPSVGKSAFAFNIARNAAVYEQKTVAIFSLEMPAVQVIERILSAEMEVDLWKLRMGKLSAEEYKKKYPKASGMLGDSNLMINDTPGINIAQLRSKARKLKMENDLDMIIVDYLQLMQARDIDNRAQAVGEISRSLKILARELDIPIITLSQLNRSIESRQDRVPQLSDLRESGSIEQDADVVMFLNREMSFEDEDESDSGRINVDLFVAKHRNGPVGKVGLEFEGAKQRFYDR